MCSGGCFAGNLAVLPQLSFNAKSTETLWAGVNVKPSFLVVQTRRELTNTQNTFLFLPPCCKGCLVPGLLFSFIILAGNYLCCLQTSTSWSFTAELVLHGAVLGGEPQ